MTLHARWLLCAALAACANDPVYLAAPASLEGGLDDGTGDGPAAARASLDLPIKLETAEDAATRASETARLGVDVPYVVVGDIEVSVEWTIRNLDLENPGTATVQLNGANEVFAYDPTLIMLGDPDEVPPAPGLAGDIPLHLEPGQTIRGLFREDQLREAAIDLDQITRANLNPFAATLQVHRYADQFQPLTAPMPDVEDYMQEPVGPPIPKAAYRQLVRIDLVFTPDRPMVMHFAVRVRDVRGILHEKLGAAATEAPGELTVFEPMDYEVTYTP